ncbi:MAG: FGGY family carbohydrate kinase [Anaerolineaceae bacterium]
MKQNFCGLDIGTSSVKAGLFDIDGHLLANAAVPIPLYSPFEGWAEQDPKDWWSAACQALKQVMEKAGSSEVVALGLSGQCPGHVLVDRDGKSLGRAIIWRDQRSQQEAHWLAESIPADKARAWAGSDFLGEATMPPARLLWLKTHAAAELKQSTAILQPKDFIGLQLTGVAATDGNSAYCLYNPQTGRYEADYFAALGVPVELMPQVLQPVGVLGKVTRAAAQATGLPEGVTVVCGTIDAYCDNLAGGAIIPGCAVDVAGTSEIVSLGVAKAGEGGGVYMAAIGEAGRFLCGPTQAGCDTLRWLSQGFYPEFDGRVDFAKLEQDASTVPAGSEGLVFLPYLNGERAPIWDSQVRGGFVGLTLAHNRAYCTRAVYEGIGFAVRHILEACEEVSGAKAKSLTVCGGGSNSTFWNQIKADILQRPVAAMEVSQTGCLGAAMLASVGAGAYPDLAAANGKMMRLKPALQPNPDNADKYERAYRRYRALYPALKPVFQTDAG